jgi:hypothetical protein
MSAIASTVIFFVSELMFLILFPLRKN